MWSFCKSISAETTCFKRSPLNRCSVIFNCKKTLNRTIRQPPQPIRPTLYAIPSKRHESRGHQTRNNSDDGMDHPIGNRAV